MVREHKIGDFVTYRQNGICRIKGIVKQNFPAVGEAEYYELTPVYDEKTVIFVPLGADALTKQMRHILSREEIDEIITIAQNEGTGWIEDTKERAQIFGDILQGGERGKILWVIKVLSLYKKELEENKRKLYASDARLLTTAEKIITEEFSFVLGIKREEVLPYILSKIDK